MTKKIKNQKSKIKNPPHPPAPFTVAVVTGSRAESGIWKPVLRAIKKSSALDLQLVITGMHLLKDFGNTASDIDKHNFPAAARVPMYAKNEPAAKGLARGIEGLAGAFRKLRPHIVLVLGDRLEMLAAANAALACRIPIAHLHGGETAPGIWDEQIRHAITKMAHLHFCSTKAAARRIMQMGEDPQRVHVTGAPALDDALFIKKLHAINQNSPTARALARQLGPIISPLLVLHPSSPDESLEYQRATLLIEILRKRFPDRKFFAIGPNNDPGHAGILRAYRVQEPHLLLSMSTPQIGFWTTLLTAGMLVGNSSSGIIEAATFGIPVLNIGDRQAGRERNINVIDAPWDEAAILRGFDKALTDRTFLTRVKRGKNLYGDGHASERIVTILEKIARTGLPLAKSFHDA